MSNNFAAILFAVLAGVAVVFQVALAFGAPWASSRSAANIEVNCRALRASYRLSLLFYWLDSH
jgi:hypothetical protein